MKPDRGIDADPLIAVSEKREQFVLGDGDGERLGEERFGGLVDVRGDIHAPDRALAVQRIAADPVGEVGTPIDAPGHADPHETLVDHAQLLLAEGVAVRDEREGVHLSFGELIQHEMSTEVAVEGMPWFKEEACRSVGIVGDGRGDGQRLVGRASRHPHVLFHPAALDGLVLVLVTPTCVGTFEHVYQTFTLLRLVAVVVHADHVAEGVEGDLLRIADAAGEDFEAAAVRFAA